MLSLRGLRALEASDSRSSDNPAAPARAPVTGSRVGAGDRSRTCSLPLTRRLLIRIELRRRGTPPWSRTRRRRASQARLRIPSRGVGPGGRLRSRGRRLIRPVLCQLSYSRVGPGRRTRTSGRRHIRPLLLLLSYPRSRWWVRGRVSIPGFTRLMRPRRRLGSTQFGRAGRTRTGVASLRARDPAFRRQPRGGSGEGRTPNLLRAKQLLAHRAADPCW